MTEQEVRRYLRQMKEESSERAFKGFYDLTYACSASPTTT